ncbi:MAG: pseudoazurin [Pseudomonadota bacterium]
MAGFAVALLLAATPLAAEEHVIQMLNIDPNDPERQHVFDPPILRIAVGDTVTFKAIDRGHNTATKRGMVPDGAEGWNGAIDEEVTITFTVPGTYGYVCLPHLEMGMVGLILVGDYTSNFEAAKRVRQIGGARRAFRTLFAAIE